MSKNSEMEPRIIISLMSGTSCDSIDVGLCQVFPDFSCKLLDGFNYKYPEEVKERIFNILLKGNEFHYRALFRPRGESNVRKT